MEKKELTYRQYKKFFQTRFFEIINGILDERVTIGGRINMFSMLYSDVSYPKTGYCNSLIAEAMSWLKERQEKHPELIRFNFGFELRETTTQDNIKTGHATVIMWFSADWPKASEDRVSPCD